MAGPVPITTSLAALLDRYDVLFCDVWGVLHNGERAFEPAVTALARARQHGATVVLVTNAPRPAATVARQLASLGIMQEAYDAIATSGDVTRALVTAHADRPLYHLGPERDRSLFDGLAVTLVAPQQAAAIVCTGLFDDITETPADYDEALTAFAKRNVPFICANPDLVVERGASLCYCAGALAELYAAKGGSVLYAGKPHAPIYDFALEQARGRRGAIDKARILAIGDGLGTDMKGAAAFGIDALFIPSGVSVPDGLPFDSADVFAPVGRQPIAIMTELAWP